MNPGIFLPMPFVPGLARLRLWPLAVAAAFLLCLPLAAPAQTPSRDEQRAAKVRTEYLKATEGMRVPTLKPADLLREMGDTNVVLIDVRQENEQRISMLPGALTPWQFAERFKRGFPTGKKVVTYCTIGYRAGKYGEQLQEHGIPVRNLEGGILGWTHAEGPLTADSAGHAVPTRRVHVYAKDMRQWLALAYEPVW